MNSALFLVDLSEMKTYLGFTDDDESRDEELGLFINLISSLADQYTGRALLSSEHTEYHDGPGSDVLVLDQYPIISTASTIAVWEDVEREFGDATAVDEGDLLIDAVPGMVIRTDQDWTLGQLVIKVQYTAGYAPVPYALRLSVLEAVAFFWKRKNEKSWGLSSISKGEGSVTRMETALPETVQEVWNRYRRKGH